MLTDIITVNQSDLSTLYDFAIKNNNNILIFGSAGCGKTEIAKQVINKNNLNIIYINLSVIENIDLIGLPSITNGKTVYNPPEFLPYKEDVKDSVQNVILFDEIDKCKDELQSALLELLQFRTLNGKPLNIKAAIATANLPDEKAFSRRLSHALTNRCSVYKVKFDFLTWLKWATENNVNDNIRKFLATHKELTLKPNDSGDPTAYCNPSPRAWTLAASDLDNFISLEEYLKLNYDPEIDDKSQIEEKYFHLQSLLISGRVGQAAASKFKIWTRFYQELDPLADEILETGTTSRVLTSDELLMCALSASSKVQHKKKDKKKYLKNFFTWQLQSLPRDYCLVSLKSSFKKEEIHKFLELEEFEKLIEYIDEGK